MIFNFNGMIDASIKITEMEEAATGEVIEDHKPLFIIILRTHLN